MTQETLSKLLDLSQQLADLKLALESIAISGDGGYIAGAAGYITQAEVCLDTGIYRLKKKYSTENLTPK